MRIAKLITRSGQRDNIECFNVNDFPYHKLRNLKKLTKHNIGHKAKGYFIEFGTYDIETTTIETKAYKEWISNGKKSSLPKCDWPYGFMYHWQMTIAGIPIYGRTWEEWISFIQKIVEIYKPCEDYHFVIYVFNLPYEFQFMRDFCNAYLGGFQIFAAQPRKPMYVRCNNGIEFRCAYKLTNMSLAKATEQEKGVVHIKAAGDLDYKIMRLPSTDLTDTEFGYCMSDVVGLHELIENRMKNDFDDLETIPLTSTGYPRRDTRKECRNEPRYREQVFLKCRIVELVYILLKEAARGGNTHAFRYLAGRIIELCNSFDMVSGYPYVQLCKAEFPISKFIYYGKIESLKELEELNKDYCTIFRVGFKNLRLKRDIPIPYLPISKATMYSIKHCVVDNGRFLSADCAAFTLTNVDWNIVKLEYEWDECFFTDVHFAKKGMLPAPIRRVIKKYFYDKCNLKMQIKKAEAAGDNEKVEDLQYLYAKSKNKLNGIFGMTYSDIIRDKIELDEGGNWSTSRPDDIDTELYKYYKSRNNFLYYAWGVWTTALCRAHLEQLLQATGGYGIGEGHSGQVIYCDTDSSKCVDTDFNLIDKLNEQIIEENIEADAFVEIEGERFYLGLYDKENDEPISKFITLGAKKYAYEDEKGFHITISGVNKKLGAKEMKCVENFKPGFIFKEAGGQTLYYNDDPIGIHQITVVGETFTTASNIGMVDSTYKLGITEDYAEIINYQEVLE